MSCPLHAFNAALATGWQVLSMEHFKALRQLGQGTFGRVVLVTKRDCGAQYAMKVMNKEKLLEQLGGDWKRDVSTERKVLADLHHPYAPPRS